MRKEISGASSWQSAPRQHVPNVRAQLRLPRQILKSLSGAAIPPMSEKREN
jgi:hypothetical protein